MESTTIQYITILAKDHTPVNEKGIPATRPVCCCSRSINGELSEWVSSLVDAGTNCSEQKEKEVLSCEDLLAQVDALVDRLEREKKDTSRLFIGSLDAKALYPSLDINRSSKIVADRMLNSDLKIDGVNWTLAAKYIALT